jgi:hypothetical protein
VGIRNNNVLKFFIILLFSFELIAPSLFSASISEPKIESSSKATFTLSSHALSSFLLLEERNEEEREGKDILLTVVLYPIYWFTLSLKASGCLSQFSVNRNLHPTQRALFKLHCVFLI